ncbi:hypothetical protein ACU4GD_01510 [Cupriavidus basilensis]
MAAHIYPRAAGGAVPALPATPAGKIQKFRLREQLRQAGNPEGESYARG